MPPRTRKATTTTTTKDDTTMAKQVSKVATPLITTTFHLRNEHLSVNTSYCGKVDVRMVGDVEQGTCTKCFIAYTKAQEGRALFTRLGMLDMMDYSRVVPSYDDMAWTMDLRQGDHTPCVSSYDVLMGVAHEEVSPRAYATMPYHTPRTTPCMDTSSLYAMIMGYASPHAPSTSHVSSVVVPPLDEESVLHETFTTSPKKNDWPTTMELEPHVGIYQGKVVRRTTTPKRNLDAQRRQYKNHFGEAWTKDAWATIATSESYILENTPKEETTPREDTPSTSHLIHIRDARQASLMALCGEASEETRFASHEQATCGSCELAIRALTPMPQATTPSAPHAPSALQDPSFMAKVKELLAIASQGEEAFAKALASGKLSAPSVTQATTPSAKAPRKATTKSTKRGIVVKGNCISGVWVERIHKLDKRILDGMIMDRANGMSYCDIQDKYAPMAYAQANLDASMKHEFSESETKRTRGRVAWYVVHIYGREQGVEFDVA
jgi:hypothetical protein